MISWVLSIGAAAVGVVALVLGIRRSMSRSPRPSPSLREGMTRIGEGHLDHRLDIPIEDEPAQVARAFNVMAGRLAESFRAMEQTLADRTMALTALHTIAVTANRSLEPDEILASVLDRVPVVLNLEGGFIRLTDENGLTLRAHRGMSPAFVEAAGVCAWDEGCSGRVAQSGTPMVFEELNESSEAALFREGFRVVACVPIAAKQHVVGTLAVASRYPRTFTPQDLQLLTSIGNQVGTALENAGLYERACAMAEEFKNLDRLKTEFLSNVSHELRIPLTSILGFAELLLERIPGELNAEQERYVRTVLDSGRSLLEMINALLDLSKIKAGKTEWRPAAFDLRPLLDVVEQTIRPLVVKKGLQVMIDVEDDPPAIVFADEGRVKQVLLNLLSNAVKFTPHGGTVTLHARTTEGLGGSAVEIRVEDTGIGIAPDELERIFEEFHQIDGSPTRDHPGTGLGLSITKRLVELQGGSISVDSRVGSGSRFTVLLPHGPREGEGAQPAARPASIMQSVMEALVASAAARVIERARLPNIVLIEPRPAVEASLRAILEGEGYEVHALRPGEPVLPRVRVLKPFMAILDCLGGAGAWAALRDVRTLPDVPTVLFAPSDDALRACSLGPVAYLSTPIVPDALKAALRRHGLLRPARRRPVTLLLIAEAGTVAAVRSALQKDGVGVVAAAEAQAVALVGELQPDAVLLELTASSNPFDVARRLEEHPMGRSIPVVALLPERLDEATGDRLAAAAGRAAAVGASLRDDVIAECRRLERLLPERAGLLDGATRLYTERYLRYCLAEEVERAQKCHRPFAVLLFEADGMARTPEGPRGSRVDRMLRELADTLRRHTRATNPLCRYGAGAFVLLIPDISKDGAWFIGEKLRALIADSAFSHRAWESGVAEPRAGRREAERERVTVACGVASFFEDADTADGLLSAALGALRRAQQTGGNRVEGADRKTSEPEVVILAEEEMPHGRSKLV